MGARAAAGLALLLALSAPLLQPGDASALRAQALAMGRGGRAEAADTWTHGSNALTDRVLYRLERVYQRSQDFENGEDVFHPSNFRTSRRRQHLQSSNDFSRRFGLKYGVHASPRGSRYAKMIENKARNLGHNLGVTTGSAGLDPDRGTRAAVTDFSKAVSGRDARRRWRDGLQDAAAARAARLHGEDEGNAHVVYGR